MNPVEGDDTGDDDADADDDGDAHFAEAVGHQNRPPPARFTKTIIVVHRHPQYPILLIRGPT